MTEVSATILYGETEVELQRLMQSARMHTPLKDITLSHMSHICISAQVHVCEKEMGTMTKLLNDHWIVPYTSI